MAEFLSEVFESMKDQLSESHLRPDNFYAQARFAKSLISKALATNDVGAARSAAAMYGGVIKRWRRWLIESLTFVALTEIETSRASVRDWQTQMFGQSVASSLLRQYGKVKRSGGGRVGKIKLPDQVESTVKLFYKTHKESIKLV